MFDKYGDLLEKNNKDKPQSIHLGENQVFKPIERAMSSPHLDPETEIFVPFAQAYGAYDMSVVFEVNEDKFDRVSPNIVFTRLK